MHKKEIFWYFSRKNVKKGLYYYKCESKESVLPPRGNWLLLSRLYIDVPNSRDLRVEKTPEVPLSFPLQVLNLKSVITLLNY